MVKLFRAEVTATGRPVLLHGEVERGMLDKIDLMFYGAGGVEEHTAEEYRDGYVVLTNYRLIWVAGSGVPCHLPLLAVFNAKHKPGMLIKSPRVKLMVRVDAAKYPTADSRSISAMAPLKMVCKGSSPDTLHTQLQRALQGQAWAAAPPGLVQQLLPAPLLPAMAGGSVPGRVAPSPLGAGAYGAAASAAAAAAAAEGAGGGGFQPDWAVVEGLCAASFPRLQAINAVVATCNAGVQPAVEWILDHEGLPALDQPSPYLADGGSCWMGPSSASAQSAYGVRPPPHPASSGVGTSFANPLLAGQPGSSGGCSSWDLLGGRGSSGSSWEVISSGGSGPGPGAAAPSGMQAGQAGGAGVALILKREEQKAAATENAMDSAFQDLDQLMRKAGEMVQLAQYFKERVARGGAEVGEEELDAETALDLLNLGIVSPITKETAGSLYNQELSRQLADFLQAPMERAGGMMPLPDVYCLYNRARGTELVSPDDLLAAIKLFPKIQAPYTLREFASGVKVVQAASHSDEAVCQRLAAMVQPQPSGAAAGSAAAGAAAAGARGETASEQEEKEEGAPVGPAASSAAVMADTDVALLATLGPSITRTEVAVGLGVPVPIAGEHLKMAEAAGVLCRDDGPEGLRYFRNFFAEPSLAAAAAS